MAKPQFEHKQTIEIPFVGELTFDGGDIDKLYNYIKEG
nr:MAG TPA_asm: Polysaccharide biosynthesis/export protein [Caudoviricetes sp.]